tara:strand:+ start:5122 stop:5604 length:483 start_codon:yes stop_codon:yes gene_type:complete
MSFQAWTVQEITTLTNAYNTLVALKKKINELPEKTTYETGMYVAVYDPVSGDTVKFPFIDDSGVTGFATQQYVDNAIADLVDSAPANLDTLNELAAALGDDPNFSTTVLSSLAEKLNSKTTGEPTGSTVVLNLVKISSANHASAVTAGTTIATTLYAIPV